LLYRTVAAMAIAALAACVVIDISGPPEREARSELIGQASLLLVPMVLMPFLGGWFLASMPADSRSWVLGGSITMTMFMGMGVGSSLLIGAYALGALWYRKINAFTVALLSAGRATARRVVREGVRKPYSIRYPLYPTDPPDTRGLARTGSVALDPYPLRDSELYANDQLRLGAKVFRFQCGVCHTRDGANGLLDLAGTWTVDQKRLNIAQLQRTKPFMPPFAGTAAELEALVQLLGWWRAGMPANWPVSADPATLGRIQAWLDEAGTRPGIEIMQSNADAALGQRAAGVFSESLKTRR
jgi:mono/diheme cytochrome c family protein